MALIEALEIKRKSFFEFENAHQRGWAWFDLLDATVVGAAVK